MQTDHRALAARPHGRDGSPGDQRARERAAWTALQATGPAEYRRALLAWRPPGTARAGALVPLPLRTPRGGAALQTPAWPRPRRRPRAKRAWWRPARG